MDENNKKNDNHNKGDLSRRGYNTGVLLWYTMTACVVTVMVALTIKFIFWLF